MSFRTRRQHCNRIQRRPRRDEQRLSILATETKVRWGLWHENLANQFSVRCKNMDPITSAGKNPAFRVASNAIRTAFVNLAKYLAAGERLALQHVKYADVPELPRIRDVKLLLIRREAESVR